MFYTLHNIDLPWNLGFHTRFMILIPRWHSSERWNWKSAKNLCWNVFSGCSNKSLNLCVIWSVLSNIMCSHWVLWPWLIFKVTVSALNRTCSHTLYFHFNCESIAFVPPVYPKVLFRVKARGIICSLKMYVILSRFFIFYFFYNSSVSFKM